jgi:hypothetical protein
LTREQYLPFLNSVDPFGDDSLVLSSVDFLLDENASPGQRWKLNGGDENIPVEVSWYAAARYANWLDHWYRTGRRGGHGSTEGTNLVGVYDTRFFDDDDFSNDPDTRNPGANCWLTTFDEWYKSAYWDGQNRVYWRYPNGSHDAPRGGFPTDPVSYGNMQVSGRDENPNRPSPGEKIRVGSYSSSGGLYGVFDLCGNVAEWTGDRSWDSWLFDVEGGRHSLGGHSGWYPDHTSRWAQVGFSTHRRNPTGRGGIRISTSYTWGLLKLWPGNFWR